MTIRDGENGDERATAIALGGYTAPAVNAKPSIAVTLGDPTGIGPEVVAKAFADDETRALARLVAVGSASVLDRALALTGSALRAQPVAGPADAVGPGAVPMVEPTASPGLASLPMGALSSEAGGASIEWVLAAARLALEESVDAIVTAPINKEAAHLAGYEDIGHMEIFQSLTGAPQVATMLLTRGLRAVHLTTHRSLRVACDYVTRENVLAKLRLTHEFFAAHGQPFPRIGVAALNPHGGEGGLLGGEEIEHIAPAVEDARREGVDAIGPVPADSVFTQAIDGRYDVVLAMYHDQGHVAVKVHGWEDSVTVNLGLPFLRTSVDHGTAFDIAGKGVADPRSMISAIRVAARAAAGQGVEVV
ncbi:MAG: 4-hydroxythreonine-4-phosphate dehydrogenase PdxA [Dehalococcoidia bacterium]|nr:4-hydroxythreonine-4-phosphate dehydrogenase PdxA [Dehalococcoidia bacterium]